MPHFQGPIGHELDSRLTLAAVYVSWNGVICTKDVMSSHGKGYNFLFAFCGSCGCGKILITLIWTYFCFSHKEKITKQLLTSDNKMLVIKRGNCI